MDHPCVIHGDPGPFTIVQNGLPVAFITSDRALIQRHQTTLLSALH